MNIQEAIREMQRGAVVRRKSWIKEFEGLCIPYLSIPEHVQYVEQENSRHRCEMWVGDVLATDWEAVE